MQNFKDNPPNKQVEPRWKAEARAAQLPVFPINIAKSGGKWNKKPLINDWVKKASYSVDRFDWTDANGYGILMGSRAGLYALDLDDYKEGCAAEQWLQAHGVDHPTRTHRTISGGRHLIFGLRGDYKYLPTRQNIVQGLDGRGRGGFIAFGVGYEVIDDRLPAILAPAACDDIQAGYGGNMAMAERDAPEPIPQGDQRKLMARFEVYQRSNATLRERWAGRMPNAKDSHGGPTQHIASSLDFSIAGMLARGGFTYPEITHVLTVFRFGKYNNSATPLNQRAANRQVERAANKAVTAAQEDAARDARLLTTTKIDDDTDAAIEAAIALLTGSEDKTQPE